MMIYNSSYIKYLNDLKKMRAEENIPKSILNVNDKDSCKNENNDMNNYGKQFFANPMKVYSKEESNAINKHLNKLKDKKD